MISCNGLFKTFQHVLPKRLSKIYSRSNTFTIFHITLIILFALTGSISKPAMANDGIVKFTTGAEYTTGNFGGTESIDQLYIPFTAKYTSKKYTTRLTIPYIRLTAPAGTIKAGGIIKHGGGKVNTESGMGDIIASATLHDAFNTESSSDVAIDFTARAKLGTADDSKGLGTGENDYTLQAELYHYQNNLLLFGMLGYEFRGDMPDSNYNDGWLSTLGGNYRLTNSLNIGLNFYYQEKSLADVDDQKELSASLRYRISDTKYLLGYVIKGFSDTSPDNGIGVLITFMQ